MLHGSISTEILSENQQLKPTINQVFTHIAIELKGNKIS